MQNATTADALPPQVHPSSTAPPVPVDNSHEAMERRGELHAMLSDCIDLAHGVGDSKRIIAAAARAVELCASHGVDDVAAMLAVIAEERS